ncbi:MAG: DUF2795 domain-containing protein [Myxococcaceae bacterium]|nr:DUF2795 domain-containing protein [Myxococcaceae bacterium]
MAEALRGAIFPLTRGEVLEVARENEAARTLLSLLSGLPERFYRSEDEVAATLDEDFPASR